MIVESCCPTIRWCRDRSFFFTYIFVNLLVDIAYVLLDPRIRY